MLLTAAVLLASPPQPAVRLQYAPMASTFIGDLSEQTRLGHSVELKTLYWRSETLPLSAHFAFDVVWGGVQHQDIRFPYPAGEELDVLGFLWRPNLCWSPDMPMSLCAGIGQGTVNVGAGKNQRDWGTWNYEIQLDVELHDHVTVFAQGKYVGRVEQEVEGIYSYFTMLMMGGGVGVQW